MAVLSAALHVVCLLGVDGACVQVLHLVRVCARARPAARSLEVPAAVLRLSPVTVGSPRSSMCLEMLEGRFLCILLGCIEIMYFLEDLVVCKFEITGRRLGTWVPRWEASRKCCAVVI